MPAIRNALPIVVPATVMSAARMPWLAPVAITSVTIGPGVTTRIMVISRKAANSSQFIIAPPDPSVRQTSMHHPLNGDSSTSSGRADDPFTGMTAAYRRSSAFLGQPLDRDHALVLGGVEHDHALGRTAGDADAVDGRADQLAAIGDQHDLIGLLDREGGDQLPVLGRCTAIATMPLPPRPVIRYS